MMPKPISLNSKTRQTIGYFAAFFCLGSVISSLGPTLPALAQTAGVSLGQIGMLFTARSFGYLSGSLICGTLYDRIRGHHLMAAMLFIGAITMNLLVWTPSLTLLAMLMFLVGISMGGMDLGSNTLMAWTHKERCGPYLNAMFVFAGVGGFLTPLLLGKVPLVWGYSLIGIIFIPTLIWLLLTPSPDIPQPETQSEGNRKGIWGIFILFTIIAFLYVGYENSYGGWIFTYFMKNGLGRESTAYLITSVFWLSLTFGRLLAILITAKFYARGVILGSILGALASGVLLVSFPQNAAAIWAGTLGIGISTAAIFPTTYSFVQSKIQITGRRNGWVWAAGSLGAMTLPWGVGYLIEAAGPLSLMITVLSVWGLALLIFLMMLRLDNISSAQE